MAEYTDLGTYIMKLFDPLIAESKEKMGECQKNFIRDLSRKVLSQTSISISRTEEFVQELSDQIIRINQDLLNQYAISIAKKTRNFDKKLSQTMQEKHEELESLIDKKDKEIEGLRAHSQSLEQHCRLLEQEKEETLQQATVMNNMIRDLQNQLKNIEDDYKYQISQLNDEWEAKFKKSQEEWDSYVKLKLAEREIEAASFKQVESTEEKSNSQKMPDTKPDPKSEE